MSVVQKSLHIISTSVVTGDLDEFTTGLSRLGTTIRETGKCLLGINKRTGQQLARHVRTDSNHGSIGNYLV